MLIYPPGVSWPDELEEQDNVDEEIKEKRRMEIYPCFWNYKVKVEE